MDKKDLLIGDADSLVGLLEGAEHIGRFERNINDTFLGKFMGPVIRRAERTARRFAADRGADVVVVSGCYILNGKRRDQYKVYIDLFRYSPDKEQEE